MHLHLAQHYGMCFGVRDALRATHTAAANGSITMLGQLVHNPLVAQNLAYLGVAQGRLEDTSSATTHKVVITAHGAADRDRALWQQAGHQVIDTTCPLVKKAHQALALLVQEGYHPVVIGQRQHVEVRGLTGDFPQAAVLLSPDEISTIPQHSRLGIISQTTQPLDQTLALVDAIKRERREAEVRFVDTICRPTKERQSAMEDLCRRCQVIIVIGGKNSNNTRQLTEKARSLGVRAHQVERPEELCADWFEGADHVGVTAGTSTLDETVRAVMDRLTAMAAK
jgi:4-hydroxy-3-methylbut-2-enyl diphosphate reductase